MQVDFAFLCDTAQSYGGKVCALGIGISVLRPPQLPWAHPGISLVAQISGSREEAGEKRGVVRILRPDGQQSQTTMIGELQFVANEFGVAATLVLTIVTLVVTRPGSYEFLIELDDAVLARLPLHVMQPPAETA